MSCLYAALEQSSLKIVQTGEASVSLWQLAAQRASQISVRTVSYKLSGFSPELLTHFKAYAVHS